MSKSYVFEVTQLIEVTAEDYEEAVANLPLYPSGFSGQVYEVTDEEVTFQYEKEEEKR